jgi:plasmid stabilization system protein ParE
MDIPGVGSQYLMAFLDAKGDVFDGATTYKASKDPQASLRMQESILETCATIGDNPEITAELTGLSVPGVGRFQVTRYSRYSVFYRIVDDQVEIIRLGCGGRD